MPNMTGKMLMFMRMHKYHVVEKSEALFQGSMLRAHIKGNGRKPVTCTLTAHDLHAMVGAGYMQALDNAMTLTEKGRECHLHYLFTPGFAT
jgi:hypothetical protein